jgi:hypothetical protein
MKFVPNLVSIKAARTVLMGKQKAPAMLFAAGITGLVGSTVLACKATLSLEETLDQVNKDLDMVKEAQVLVAQGELENDEKYARSLRVLHVKAALQVAKLYAPSVVLGLASITALSTSQHILTRRNAALMAAYTGLDKAYKEYRSRVQEELGKDREKALYYDYTECELVDEKGKVTKVMQPGTGHHSPYARFFDETCASWERDSEYNLMFLKAQEDFANRRLRTRGHVFLNEVYDALGIPHSREGALVGWVIQPNGKGDNFIDFGLENADSERVRSFVNGYEKAILVDFNVDGLIVDKI